MEKKLKQPHIAAFVKNIKSVQPKKQLNFEKILRGVQNDQLYGFLFVEIRTPEHLKEKYSDFPMIIKNVMVSKDDLSPYVKVSNLNFILLVAEFFAPTFCSNF